MNLVLLEGDGRVSGDMFLKYHKQTLYTLPQAGRWSKGFGFRESESTSPLSNESFQSVITHLFSVIPLAVMKLVCTLFNRRILKVSFLHIVLNARFGSSF